jgi:hypothetical protein
MVTIRTVSVLMLAWSAPSWAQDLPSMTSEIERTADTTNSEKQAYAASAMTEMGDTLKQVTRLIEGARKDSDAEKVMCLTSRISSVRALNSVTEAANRVLGEAIDRGDSDRAAHEFRKIAVALNKTRVLLAESIQCDQGQKVQPGETLVDLLSGLVSEDELESILDQAALDGLDVGVYDPPEVSPFL